MLISVLSFVVFLEEICEIHTKLNDSLFNQAFPTNPITFLKKKVLPCYCHGLISTNLCPNLILQNVTQYFPFPPRGWHQLLLVFDLQLASFLSVLFLHFIPHGLLVDTQLVSRIEFLRPPLETHQQYSILVKYQLNAPSQDDRTESFLHPFTLYIYNAYVITFYNQSPQCPFKLVQRYHIFWNQSLTLLLSQFKDIEKTQLVTIVLNS